MADLIFLPIADKIESGTYLVYDGACGTGGMLTVAQERLQVAHSNGGRSADGVTLVLEQLVDPVRQVTGRTATGFGLVGLRHTHIDLSDNRVPMSVEPTCHRGLLFQVRGPVRNQREGFGDGLRKNVVHYEFLAVCGNGVGSQDTIHGGGFEQ